MKLTCLHSLLIALLLSTFLLDAKADVQLPRIFSNNMVLQRERPVKIWGWAEPGERVTIELGNSYFTTYASHQGRWSGVLPALPTGGPYTLVAKGKNEIRLTNILSGDVWICGGQSNMQWSIGQTGYQEKDSSFIRSAKVRLFTVPVDMDYMPREDVKGGEWKELSFENISNFSAVSYHFGKYVNEHINVPIGLISDNLGATSIEVWMSNESLLRFPQFHPLVKPLVNQGKNFAQLTRDFEKIKRKWNAQHYYRSEGIRARWYDPNYDTSEWEPVKVCGNTWEHEPELKNHDGEVWFRTTFDLPTNMQGDTFKIHLGQIDDYDIAWVNGTQVGETCGKHNHRNYSVPAKLLKVKGNSLVVRVVDVGGIGGFTTSEFWGNPILWGKWTYRKGESINPSDFPQPNLPNATPFSSPGVLYNAIIAPLTKFTIKGVIWYQGESNVDRAYEYRDLFPAMITGWRSAWDLGDFPFLFVQLANHYAESSVPGESTWAELREAQAMTLTLPNTGMVTAIDIGEADDIHPKNKLDVGNRLGLVAIKVAYGKQVDPFGPTFRIARFEGNTCVIEFTHADGGLITKDKHGYVRGFQIAGSDRKFSWAKARISGNTVLVESDEVKQPVAVRYAWDDNPGQLDLYNRTGLPAIPFRTDSWDGITVNKVFADGPRF